MMDKDAKKTGTKKLRSRLQAGNAIVMLFAAIGMAGVVTYSLNNVIRGPAVTTAEVSRRTMAENNLIATTRLAISAASQQAAGDCDDDGFIEPVPYRAAGGAPAPVGGGLVPSTIGASMADPWGVQYGYCVWDPGTASVSDAVAACGGATPRRLEGAPRDDQYAIAVISAGKNGAFETNCNAYVDTTPADGAPDTVMLNKPAGSDDIVLAYSYAEANGIGGGEWKLKAADPTTAEIGKNLEIGSAANPRGATFNDGALTMSGARGLVLPGDPGDDTVTGACDAAKESQLRRNIGDGSEVPVIEICHDTAWTPVTGGTTIGQQCQPEYDTWALQSAAGTREWEQIAISADGQTIAAVTAWAGTAVYYSNDGGTTWAAGNVTGLFVDVAVSADGNTVYVNELYQGIRKSTDGGATWTAAQGLGGNWTNIDISSDGNIVAVSQNNGQIGISTNGGASFTLRESVRAWYDITISANGTRMAAIVDNGYVYTSTDTGTTWTQRDSARSWGAITSSSDGMKLAATVVGGRIWTSVDGGVTWAQQAGSPSGNWWEITSSSDGTRLLGTMEGGQVYSSEDSGVTWVARGVSRGWHGIASSADGTKIAAVVYNGGIYTSDGDCPDTGAEDVPVCGEDWEPQTTPATTFYSIAYGAGKYVATGQSSVLYSIDGENWVSAASIPTGNWISVTYGNGIFVAVAFTGTTSRAMTSTDGINWTARTTEANEWTSVAYGNGVFVAVARTGTNRAMTSTDGITWTPRTPSQTNSWEQLSYGNGLFVAVSSNGTNRVMTSPDGITWTMRTAAASLQWEAITYGNGQFVALGRSGANRIMRSSDGITWTALAPPEANTWRGIAYGNGRFVGVSESGTNRVMTSTDAVTWLPQEAAEQNAWDGIAYADGKFIAVSLDGTHRIMTSTCGASVTDTITATPHPLDEGLIAHWKLDEGTGTAVEDSAGSNDGVLVNTPIWAAEGPHGTSSLNFKKDDRGAVQINGLLGQPSDGTIAAWVNIESMDTLGTTIFSIGDNISLVMTPADGLRLSYWDGSTTRSTSSADRYNATGWHYVVATFSSTNDAFRLYMDGTSIGSTSATQNISWTPRGANTFIGRHGDANTNFDLDGSVDDVRVYGRALSPNEVLALTERAKNESLIRDVSYSTQAPVLAGQLTVGGEHACAINKDKGLWCWGSNANGKLGNTNYGATSPVPVSVMASPSEWSEVAAGTDATCAIKADETLWCWGNENAGQFGNGGGNDGAVPLPFSVNPAMKWSQISMTYQHACGITTAGALYCWGSNVAGKLGNGNTTQQFSPVQIGTDRWKFVSAGYHHTCGIKADGSGWCWGDDANGRLGNGAALTGSRSSPSPIEGGHVWSSISAKSNEFTCGVTKDGMGWCWGSYANGKLGNGTVGADQVSPLAVSDRLQWKEIITETGRACGVTVNGAAYCWGLDTNGELGNGATTGTQWTPNRVLLPNPVSTLQLGYDFACAMEESGRVWCWGEDGVGQLGNGAALTGVQTAPTSVVGFPNPSPFLWNSAHNNIMLNPGMTIALGNKWLSDDGTARYFGFDGPGIAKLAQTSSSNQLLVDSTFANSSAQMSFRRGDPAVPYVDTTAGAIIWTMDETSGTAVPSSSANAYPGTISGRAVWNATGGITSPSLEFDGSTGRVSVTNHAAFRPAGSYAIAVLIRPDGVQAAGATILSKSYNNGQYDSYALKFTSDQKISFVTTGTGPTQHVLTSTQAVRPNAWTIVTAFSVDTGGGTASKGIAINNVVDPYVAALNPIYSTDATGNLFFGAGGCAAPCNGFKGSIDGIRVYGIELTSAVFQQIYGFQSSAFAVPKTIGVDYSTNSIEIGTNNAAASNWLDTIAPEFSLPLAGNVGIGTTTPAAKVDVAGGVRVGYQTTCAAGSTGTLRYTGNSRDAVTVAAASLPAGAVAYWNFNETSGTTAADSIGGITGTLYGNATFAAGRSGNALSLDGAGDYMRVGATAALNDLPAVTACAWINGPGNQPSGTYQGIVMKANNAGAVGWNMYTGDDMNPTLIGLGAQGRGGSYIEKTNLITPSTWSHICMTWNGGIPSASNKPYLNGVEIVAPWDSSGGGGATSDAAFLLSVGATQNGSSGWLGLIDEVVVFNRVLNTAEIQQVMTATGSSSVTSTSTCLPKASVGKYHGCAVGYDQKAYCWGLGTLGRLGDGTSASSSLPVATASGAGPGKYKSVTTSKVVAGVTGANFSCGLGTDDRAYCWGFNGNGQLGDNTTTDRTSPVLTLNGAGPGAYTYISIGTLTSCGIGTDGRAYCWGDNSDGQIGDNTYVQRNVPTLALNGAGPGTYKTISSGRDFTCAIGTDDRAYCWGNNGHGQLGNNTIANSRIPVLAVAGAGPGTYVSISSGDDHTCAIGTDQRAYCWGAGLRGMLGDNTATERWLPTLVVNGAGTGTFSKISAGTYHTCGVGTDKKAYCWGSNSRAQIGDGTTTQRDAPVLVLNGDSLGAYKEIIAGERDTCALGTDNRLYCWGDNVDGTLADGTATQRAVPTLALSGDGPGRYDSCPGETTGTYEYCNGTTWGAVGGTSAAITTLWSKKEGSLTTQHASCSIRHDGSAWCWGRDVNNRLGNGTDASDQPSPSRVISTAPWKFLSTGDNHTCGIDKNGLAWCWGGDNAGQVGDGAPTAFYDVPQQVNSADTWIDITGGYRHSCGIKFDGTAWCWGTDLNGRLGNGAPGGDQVSPTQVTGTGTWTDIEAGETSTCGIKNDGTAWCWGSDTDGQLGNGATAGGQISPTLVDGAGTWIDITVGQGSACGIKNDGTAWCWGSDTDGELGNGATAGTQISPTQVTGTGTWIHIDAGHNHACGIKNDGTGWCWGFDDFGQLGNGAITGSQPSPYQIEGGGTWINVLAGERTTCGTRPDGTNWCWGSDVYGELGNGTVLTGDQISPTLVQ